MEKNVDIPQVRLATKTQRLSALVREQLINWIMDGTLKRDQKISEDEIATKLGVSRMPVREAFRLMESMGLIQSTPYAGSVVRKLTKEETKEIYILRMNLESLACRYAAERVTLSELIEIEEIQRKMESVCEYETTAETYKLLYQYNRDFHHTIYAASKMPKLCEFIDNLWNSIAYSRIKYISNAEYGERMKQEHRFYIDCLKRHDGEAFASGVVKNLQNHYDLFAEKEEEED